MYEAFFGFRERPFDLSPSPRFLVMTESHREALGNLEYAIASRTGLTLLLGEAGSGKTTMIRAAIESRSDRVHCIHISNPTLGRQEFNEMIARKFGLSPAAAGSKAAMLIELEALLHARLERGETSLLVLDEAQSMPLALLEEVRLLANIETNEAKLLSIVMAGQPELADRLNQHDLRQLKQRVALRCDIRPLSREETDGYMAGRLRAAGGSPAAFTPDAVALVHRASRGLPRTINVIADNALLGAFAAGQPVVDSTIVQAVCRDFDFDAGPGATGWCFDKSLAVGSTAPTASMFSDAPTSPPDAATTTAALLPTRPDRARTAMAYAAGIGVAVFIVMVAIAFAGLRPARPAEVVVAEPTAPATVGDTRPVGSEPKAPGPTAGDSQPRPSRRPDAFQLDVAPDRRATSSSAPSPTAAAAVAGGRSVSPVSEPVAGTSQPAAPLPIAAPGGAPVPLLTLVPAASGLGAPPVPSRPMPGSTSAGRSAVDPQVQSVLNEYRRAFSTLSASGVSRFWPSVNTRNLQRAFDQIDSQRLEFDSCVMSTAPASRAQVSCGGTAVFVPKVGNRSPRIETRRWTFHLSRAGATWVIDRVESE